MPPKALVKARSVRMRLSAKRGRVLNRGETRLIEIDCSLVHELAGQQAGDEDREDDGIPVADLFETLPSAGFDHGRAAETVSDGWELQHKYRSARARASP
jgi:homoaconitase/3-isopropylmalate dehydratase large subunit